MSVPNPVPVMVISFFYTAELFVGDTEVIVGTPLVVYAKTLPEAPVLDANSTLTFKVPVTSA